VIEYAPAASVNAENLFPGGTVAATTRTPPMGIVPTFTTPWIRAPELETEEAPIDGDVLCGCAGEVPESDDVCESVGTPTPKNPHANAAIAMNNTRNGGRRWLEFPGAGFMGEKANLKVMTVKNAAILLTYSPLVRSPT
jgi:hypothetical protein